MKHYIRQNKSIESIAIGKIEMGINSIRKGIRSGEDVGADLDYFFNQLEKVNKAMYEDLFMKYSIARLEAEKKEIKKREFDRWGETTGLVYLNIMKHYLKRYKQY
jgi:hypothetical protein